MENGIFKRIDTKDGKIIYQKNPNGYITFFSITYLKLNKENETEKRLQFSMWDDFQFEGDPKEFNLLDLEKIEFDIEKDNLLFESIKRFLDKDKEFVLDDDATWGINNKIMKITNNEESIKVEFINNGKGQEEQSKLDRYKVFIKNIISDGRSKLDDIPDNPTKGRLRNLFLDLRKTLAGKEELEDIMMKDTIYYFDDKMLFSIIPELKDCDGFEQKNKYHEYDVWEHTKNAIRSSQADLEIRLALLLHDIGKPHSYQEDEDGVRHFKGHPQKSAEIAEKILTRLGYEEQQKNNILYLIENHATIIDVDRVNKNNLEITKKLLYVQYCDNMAYAPKYAKKCIKKLDEIKEKLEEKINKTKEIEER